VALLINDVDTNSGTWMSLMTRAFGMYHQEHPEVRWPQRLIFGLNRRILPEDMTDQGSIFHDGLWMASSPDTTIKQVVWSLDKGAIKEQIAETLIQAKQNSLAHAADAQALGSFLGPFAQAAIQRLKLISDDYIRGPLAQDLSTYADLGLRAAIYQKRDPAETALQLKRSICDQRLPATVFKYEGAHEASILNFVLSKSTPDGRHSSKYGFVTIRDQAGLSGDEQEKIKAGKWWREPGMDEKTVCMPVEDFTSYYNGFSSVLKR
jgi:hypothetical protein